MLARPLPTRNELYRRLSPQNRSVQDDLDDTIARGSRPRVPAETVRAPDVDDTIIVGRASAASRPSALSPSPAEAAHPAPVEPGSHALVEPGPRALVEPGPRALVEPGPPTLVEPTVLTTRSSTPALVEPARATDTPEPTPFTGVETAATSNYRFRIGGTVVFLDRAAYIGRNPSRPRVLHDGLPRLVQVPSAGKEVSSTHVEVRQRGASVVVTDLRSTNGTIVNIPGGTPTKLRQGESMVVTPGTLIDIGDGNLIEILPLQRR